MSAFTGIKILPQQGQDQGSPAIPSSTCSPSASESAVQRGNGGKGRSFLCFFSRKALRTVYTLLMSIMDMLLVPSSGVALLLSIAGGPMRATLAAALPGLLWLAYEVACLGLER